MHRRITSILRVLMTQARWKMWGEIGDLCWDYWKTGRKNDQPNGKMSWMEVRMEIVQMAVEKARGVTNSQTEAETVVMESQSSIARATVRRAAALVEEADLSKLSCTGVFGEARTKGAAEVPLPYK